jgi:hypothetical protein
MIWIMIWILIMASSVLGSKGMQAASNLNVGACDFFTGRSILKAVGLHMGFSMVNTQDLHPELGIKPHLRRYIWW